MSTRGRSKPPAFLASSHYDIYQKFADLEWRQRRRVAPSPPSNEIDARWARASGPDVAERNRYVNIEPWDANRVKLRVPDGVCDYINASHISLRHSRSGTVNRFIATQGPKETSRGHFWQMMWDETDTTGVIVMLTQTHEGAKEKCFAYFPQDAQSKTLEINPSVFDDDGGGDGDSDDDDDVAKTQAVDDEFKATVELLSTDFDDTIKSTVRKLSLTVGDQSKTIYHYLFSAWPDFGIPENEDRQALLKLIRDSTAMAASPSNPRIVHCSAGVGRSGSFIALDYLVGELDEGSLDNLDAHADPIADCVNSLREQRMMMVQGDNQFKFLYQIMRDLWYDKHGVEKPQGHDVEYES